MDEIEESINKKTSIMLSRNTPVSLVVGAAGFLGSYLVDKLLDKGIQVIGVDDLSAGRRQNLQKATEDKNFHLIIESPDKVELDLSRLDYLFITSGGDWDLGKVLDLFRKTKCRCLFISSIDLYRKDNSEGVDLQKLKDTEGVIAKFAGIHKLNARILRLGPVFGPRMDFKTQDPLIRLVAQSLTGDLQRDVTLEFSSRALYIADAMDLIVKTIMAGSTAQKIYDGVRTEPIKVSEIKQVLMDPVWYETRDFVPSPLPPWPTPNLEKTVKFLNWHPKSNLITSLRVTLSYFKDNEIEVPKIEDRGLKIEDGIEEDKKELLEQLKPEKKQPEVSKIKKKSRVLSKIYLFLLISLVTYALIWPSVLLGWGILTFKSQMASGLQNLEKGDFDKSLESISQASGGLEAAKSVFQTLEPIKKTGFFETELERGDQLITLSSLSVSSAQSAVLGVKALLQGLKAVTGELTESPAGYFETAQIELSAAAEDLSKASVSTEQLAPFANLVSKAQTMSILLPEIVGLEGNKSYLILLQNNMELRPGGGFIGSFAKVSFAEGKLKKLDVNDIYAIDGQLKVHVEPPKEIKDDLSQKDWFLRDSNWESDFPASARQAEWFYTKETGERVEGVIALDVSAMEELLTSIGSLDLADYKENITAENLFEKAISHAELSFFPGSQAKKSFLTALTSELFNKMFFLPQNNWPEIISSLGKSLEEKHISIYLDDPKLFSYIMSQNWAHNLPRQSTQNANIDFLSMAEANLGANKANYYLDRSYNLETVVGKFGEVKHRLRISYTNRSPSDTFPGGKYKNRMRVYLPFGSKMTRALWGENDITKDVTSFVDYGRSGSSMLLELYPKEQKILVLDYTASVKLDFKEGKADYKLDIIKQPGTLKDPFKWVISYPLGFQVASDQTKTISPQQQTIQTDLSQDRSFEVQFSK